jgi:hypothetical protein
VVVPWTQQSTSQRIFLRRKRKCFYRDFDVSELATEGSGLAHYRNPIAEHEDHV